MKIEPITEIDYRVGIINSIQKKHKFLRQNSKPVTFALQYQGTHYTLMKNSGFSEEEAIEIERNYHESYKESKKWLDKEINKARKYGFVIGAFGLKIRTPILHQTVGGIKKELPIAKAEARTAGNAIQQSWCLLNNRALTEFLRKLRKSEYATRIRPCALIHDALYFLVDNDPDVVIWLNDNLIPCLNWNNHPAIYDPDVGLEGELSLFVPTWNNEIPLPNNITKDELVKLVQTYEDTLND